jgi:DNA gyrase/topoisomerase IV subunit A
MSRKPTQATVSGQPTLINYQTSEYISKSSRDYAIYTAQNRAIPSSCDGLKDGQRKFLWLMAHRTEKIKTVSLAGLSLQEGLFLHGDASASDTISRLAAPFLNNMPLFEGVGAFGTRVAPDGWGAPRYTYVKRSKVAERLLYNDLDIVPLRDNYDGSNVEPVNFLPLIPLVLLNGVSGIAVGWSTEILPHKLEDLVEATLAAIDGKPVPKLKPHYQMLDVGINEIAPQSYEFSGKATITGGNSITVTELPPDLSLEKFRARLNVLEDSGKIVTYVDRSTKTINVEVRVRRGELEGWTDVDAVKFLKLTSKATQRIVVLDWNNTSIKQYDCPEDLVRDFVEWRLGWYTTRFQHQIKKLNYDLNFARAIKACVDSGLPAFLPQAKNKSQLEQHVNQIVVDIPLDDAQFQRLVGLPSYRWAQDSIGKIDSEITSLVKQIGKLEDLLKNPKQIRQVYRNEVQNLLKA